MKRFALLASLSLLLLIGFALPASAQDEWTCFYNFAVSDGGFAAPQIGIYSPGVGWVDEYVQAGDLGYRGIDITVNFSVTTTLTSVTYTFSYSAGILGVTGDSTTYAAASSIALINFITPTVPTSPQSWSGSVTASNLKLQILAGIQRDVADPGGSVTLTELILEGEGDAPCEQLEEFEASFDAMPEEGAAPLTVLFTNTSVGNSINHWDFGDGNTYNGPGDPMHIYEVPGLYTVTLTIDDGNERTDSAETVILVEQPLIGDFYKPLNEADAHTGFLYPPDQEGLFDFTYADEVGADNGGYDPVGIKALDFFRNLKDAITTDPTETDSGVVSAISVEPNRPIHAVAGGIVTRVQAITGCGNNEVERCIFHIPRSINDGVNDIILRAVLDSAYVVTVATGGREVSYIINSPQLSVGDEIEAGCIIGYTMQVVRLNPWEIQAYAENIGASFDLSALTVTVDVGASFNYVLTSQIVPYGAAFLRLTDNDNDLTLPLLDQLVQDATSLVPCNADPNHRTCQGDGSLSDASLWQQSGGVSWPTNGKPTLSPGGSITQQLALSPDVGYSMRVQTNSTSAGQISMRIGQTTSIAATNSGPSEYGIDAAVHEADMGLFYSITVLNTGPTPIALMSICVQEGDADAGSSVCVFQNPSLDNVGARWSFSTTGVYQGLQDGELAMDNGAYLSQAIRLYPDTYTIELRATATGVDQPAAADSFVGFEWSFDGGMTWVPFTSGGEEMLSILSFADAYTPANGIVLNGFGERLFTSTIPITTVTSGAFTVRAVIDLDEAFDPAFFNGMALVREVCIPSDSGGGDPDGGGPLPYDRSCSAIGTGNNENISTWTIFLWRSLDRFFRCDLITAINNGIQGVQDILTFLRWQLLWWQSYIAYFSQWIGDSFVPWLNGHFANVARNGGILVQEQGGGGVGFWDVLYAIITRVVGPIVDFIKNLLEKAVDLLFDLVRRFLDLALRVVGLIFDLIRTLITWIQALAYAWNNAAPKDISWLPDCSANPKMPACIPGWIAQNTIFDGLGALIIPLLVGIQILDLILWAIFSTTDTIKDVGSSS